MLRSDANDFSTNIEIAHVDIGAVGLLEFLIKIETSLTLKFILSRN